MEMIMEMVMELGMGQGLVMVFDSILLKRTFASRTAFSSL